MKAIKIESAVAKPQDFRNTKYFVANKEESEALQKAMFKMGFCWCFHEKGDKRETFEPAQYGHWLFVDKDCRIYWNTEDTEAHPVSDCVPAFQASLHAAAETFHKQKRIARKEKRQSKQIKKLGFTTRKITDDVPDLSNAMGVLIRLRNKDIIYWDESEFKGLQWGSLKDCDGYDGSEYEIVGYTIRYGKEKSVSLKDMVEGIVKDAGGHEIVSATDTNPKRQYGLASIPLNLWSPLASAYGAVGLYNGSLKYGRGNYKATPVEASIYIAAAMRHLVAWAEGEEYDQADGVPNLGGVLANIAILIDSRAAGTMVDDRELPGGYLKEREKLKEIVKSLQVLHEGKTPKHFNISDK